MSDDEDEKLAQQLRRRMKTCENCEKLKVNAAEQIATLIASGQEALIVAAQAAETHRKRAEELRQELDAANLVAFELGKSVACALDYDYLLKLVARVCLVYRAVRPDIEQDARHDLRWRELKDALDAFPDGP